MTYSKEKRYETILVIILGLIIFYLIYKNPMILYVGMGIGILGLLFSAISLFITKIWYGFANTIGKVVSTVLLSVIFYSFLFPISVVYRLFNKDNSLQLKKKSDTYYYIRDHNYDNNDLENPW